MAQQVSSPPGTAPARVTAFRILAVITMSVIVLQFVFAGWGTFDSLHSTAKAGDHPGFGAHEMTGYLIALLGVVLLVAALLAGLGARAASMAVAMAVLAGPVQALLARAGEDSGPLWGALHALVGMMILGIGAGLLTIRTSDRTTDRTSEPTSERPQRAG
jgi:hypothetical protein